MFDSPRRRPGALNLERLDDRITPVVAADDFYNVASGELLNVSSQDGVLSNDQSFVNPGTNLRATVETPPQFLEPGLPAIDPDRLDLNDDGSFSFLAPDVPSGTVQFTYSSFDPDVTVLAPDNVDFATVTIVIQPEQSQVFAAGADAGGGPAVRVFDAETGIERFSFMAFEEDFTGGVRVAVGDVTGDGIDDVIAGAGPGREPTVRIYEGDQGNLISEYLAYEQTFFGGVFVSTGDINGDGVDDVVVGSGDGGGPRVRAFSSFSAVPLVDFFAYESTFRGGVTVAAGDLRDVDRDAIIAGAGPGGGPLVRAFDPIGLVAGLPRTLLEFFAFNPDQRGGVNVAAGDFGGSGEVDILVGAGSGSPVVNIHDGETGALKRSFEAFPEDVPTGGVFLGGGAGGFGGSLLPGVVIPGSLLPSVGTAPTAGGVPIFGGGVRVAVVDRNNDGVDDIVTGAGPGATPRLRTFDGVDLTEIDNLNTFGNGFRGGIFVGGGRNNEDNDDPSNPFT